MQGVLFLGVMWAVWVIATFFMDKSDPLRRRMAFASLLFIIVFPYQLKIGGFSVQWTAVFLIAAGYLYFARFRGMRLAYQLVYVWIAMTGYTGMLLFELYDPVWIMANRMIFYSIFIFIIAQLASSSFFTGTMFVVLGTAQGEIGYALAIMKWGFHQTAGSYSYLDIIALFLCLQCSWGVLNHLITALSENMR